MTGSIPIGLDLRVDEGPIQKILDLVPKNRRELHHAIPNHHSLEVYRRSSVQIIPINQHSEVRNILASIRLTCQEKWRLFVLWKLVEEVKQSIQVVSCSVGVTVVIRRVGVV